MILQEATYFKFGYYPYALKPQSNKKILAKCDGCGKIRSITKQGYRALCRLCSQKDDKHPMFGKHHTDQTKRKIGEGNRGKTHTVTEEAKRKISEALKGEKCYMHGKPAWNRDKTHTEATKRKISKALEGKTGEKASRWKGGKKLRISRSNAKRKRQLGFTPVLSQNSGEVWHHFTNDYVIGIPEEVHNKCGGRRQKHRRLVLEWLKQNDKVKYLIIQSFKNTLEGWI